MENSPPQQVKDVTDGWGGKLSSFFSIILMLQIAVLAIIAISEIAARESVLSMLTGRIVTLKSEFVERNRTEISIPAESGPTDISIPVKPESSDRARLLREIESYESLKRGLIFLIAQGSSHPALSLNTIQQFEIYDFTKDWQRQISKDRYERSSNFTSVSYEQFLLLSSDQLLAIAIMACAAMGAMIAALRGNGLMTLRALTLGIATGFVVYLAIKGGKHVFLLQMQGEIVAFNPYGSAFAGLLAGLFTEKAYQVLTTIVDEFADRLRVVSTGKKDGD